MTAEEFEVLLDGAIELQEDMHELIDSVMKQRPNAEYQDLVVVFLLARIAHLEKDVEYLKEKTK